jgi:hypothetical protein
LIKGKENNKREKIMEKHRKNEYNRINVTNMNIRDKE